MQVSTALMTIAIVLMGAACVTVVVRDLRRRHHEDTLLRLLELFGPSVARVQLEPRELVPWSGVAKTGRNLFPQAFHDLDRASGGTFPFSADFVESVHARWTTRWLTWERDHDVKYKRRSAELEAELDGASSARDSVLRAELAQVEQEKLQRYQERYEEYVTVGKAIEKLE